MIGFTLFLIYTAIYRNDANCHCFGSFIEINPVESIIKNIGWENRANMRERLLKIMPDLEARVDAVNSIPKLIKAYKTSKK